MDVVDGLADYERSEMTAKLKGEALLKGFCVVEVLGPRDRRAPFNVT